MLGKETEACTVGTVTGVSARATRLPTTYNTHIKMVQLLIYAAEVLRDPGLTGVAGLSPRRTC